ncbi:hypothetical protein [Roseococcus sp. YIM B11640]|uniref:hypothetical protein n=1 Tax=Roseococcus sp. YIM B11640 TaxID=3133973 RepID=UPI003C7AD755
MRRIGFSALILVATIGLAAAPASAQQVTAQGVYHGQAWNMGQDLNSLDAMTPQTSPRMKDRNARAQRQAQFNRYYSGVGTPVRRTSLQTR